MQKNCKQRTGHNSYLHHTNYSKKLMKILVTGATGFIGSNLVKKLPEESTRLAVRHVGNRSKCEEISIGNLDSTTDWTGALTGIDTVVHLAGVAHSDGDDLDEYFEINCHGTINLAKQAVESNVKRFIFLSSIKVNGECSIPGTPFKASDARKPETTYASSKSKAEMQLQELAEKTEMEIVILRAPLVYGPGVKANFSLLVNVVGKGLPLPFDSFIQNKRSFVFIDNLISLIITCLDHPEAANEVFLVSDGKDLSTQELVSEISVVMGKKITMFNVPMWCFKIILNLLGKKRLINRLSGSLQVDIVKTQKLLGWSPHVSVRDGLRKTIQT